MKYFDAQQFRRFCRSLAAVALAEMVSAMLFLGQAFAQNPTPDKANKSSKAEQPLELPEFVITGVETLDVPGGAKQAPKTLPKLSPQELKRFNPLDKLSFTLLPQQSGGRLLLPQQEADGFLRGEFGFFLTPRIEAGYRFIAGNFDLNAKADVTNSAGHRRNAGFTDAALELRSQYLAPDKFFFFGGSRTDTYLRAAYRDYRFFGADSSRFPEIAPRRESLLLEGGVKTIGSFENVQYDMGASAESLLLNEVLYANNTLVSGHLVMKAALGGALTLGGAARVQLQNDPLARWLYLLSPAIVAEYRTETLAIAAEIGIQLESYRSSINPTASIHAAFAANSWLSLELNAFSGLRQNSLLQAFRKNPYIMYPFFSSRFPAFPNESVLYDVQGLVRLHPLRNLNFSLGGGAKRSFNALLFDAPEHNGSFVPVFQQLSLSNFFVEADIQISPQDYLTTRLDARFGVNQPISNLEVPVSYLVPLEGSLIYQRRWFEAFSSRLEAVYVGERWAALFNPSAANLPAYVDVRLHLDYEFSKAVSVYLRGSNLLNQPIFIWRDYQERGTFIAAGIVVVF